MTPNNIAPVRSSERHAILDVLRGIALFGICLANYPEFSLYTFQTKEVGEAMPTASIDHIIRFLQYLFIDGKFYTLFSLLFGIGFSIIISNAMKKGGNGMKIFYRRTTILIFIGLFHLIFLWAGDILILYAVVGLFLPLFRNVSDKKLILFSVLLLFFPILIDGFITFFNLNLSAPVISATQYFHNKAGITEENFPVWLVEGKSYMDILKFNLAGAFIRMQEFIDGNRIFKVLGLFLLGLYIGRNRIYANLNDNKKLLKQVIQYGLLIGLSISILYAWESTSGHPFGLVGHSIIYAISVVPLSLAYASIICLWYLKNKERKLFNVLAAPGRMALTNYIMQSVFGIIIFYGIGFELGAKIGLVYVELIAMGVFLFQVFYSYFWLRYFQFGLLEWCWRMLTYGKRLKLTKQTKQG
ncbi:MAG: DUF418 domain-containing protein [Prevotellaceae bacterium]|jgi:uncharacterized protein|nr:DUF418 domain-containing protein [Prevotellaceae bacterium]